jgi:hypothetical protein
MQILESSNDSVTTIQLAFGIAVILLLRMILLYSYGGINK